jgi:hypothetical protein
MKAVVTITSCALLLAANAAFADANVVLKPPRVYTGVHPPGPPGGTKPSSFAPHPGSKRHVYGAPIQGPIFKSQPKPKLKSSVVPPPR